MTQPFPFYISFLFLLITGLTLYMFSRIIRRSSVSHKMATIFAFLTTWLFLQAALAINDVYSTNLQNLPPKILVLGILPPFVAIFLVMFTKNGKIFTYSLPLQLLTLLSVVRIGVEVGLLLLHLNKTVPREMTMEGGNLDIISGITAPLVAWYAFMNGNTKRLLLIIWNFLCLIFLLNIFIRALLSAPFPLQKLAFNQPNVAILHFPVVWLPTFIVPLIFFSHLASIRQLMTKPKTANTNYYGIID